MDSTSNTEVRQDAASLSLRDAVYCAVLDASILFDWHRAKLRARGFTDDEIDRRHYRSDNPMVAERLAGQFDRLTLLSVPGFTLQNGWLRFKSAGGIWIPCRDASGRIVALKVRRDHVPPDGAKYLYCTSAPDGGPGPGSPAHVALGIRGPIDRLRCTEGELKSDIATFLNCVPTISIPGVGQWRSALPVIAQLQAKIVVVAFDSDAKKNRDVAQHQLNFAEHLYNEGIGLELETWDGPAKGIDDFLLLGGRPTVHVGAAALWMAREIAKQAGVDPSQPKAVPRPKVSKRAASKTPSELSRAKAAIELGPILNEVLGIPKGNRWTCRCGGKITIRHDQLGIERAHCWGSCGLDEDAPGFLCLHYAITFREACERLGLPVPKAEPKPEPVPEPEPELSDDDIDDDSWASQFCPNSRSEGVLLRKKGQTDVISVHPPCGNRAGCEACSLMWQYGFRKRFRLGLELLRKGQVFKIEIEPAEWKATQARLSRFAKRNKIELLYATCLCDTPTGGRTLLVISNLPLDFDDRRPVKPETASRAWCAALRAAVVDQERPVNFSTRWPREAREPSDYEHLRDRR